MRAFAQASGASCSAWCPRHSTFRALAALQVAGREIDRLAAVLLADAALAQHLRRRPAPEPVGEIRPAPEAARLRRLAQRGYDDHAGGERRRRAAARADLQARGAAAECVALVRRIDLDMAAAG